MKLLVHITIPEDGISAYREYESIVLALLVEHGGTLLGHYRNETGTEEFHIVEFSTESDFDNFGQDPRRIAAKSLWDESGATSTITEIFDVD
ncbi:MAG: hypothetical protein KF824_05155 [Fimbriimonadaceae bacterium]|nr:MAG: hypothetical protein KF824_05155 [Fimbriimonadaceae bacterium]